MTTFERASLDLQLQAELKREELEARDTLGVNDEAQHSAVDLPVPIDAGCTDTALCGDLEWGGPGTVEVRTPPFVLPVQDTERDTFDEYDEETESEPVGN